MANDDIGKSRTRIRKPQAGPLAGNDVVAAFQLFLSTQVVHVGRRWSQGEGKDTKMYSLFSFKLLYNLQSEILNILKAIDSLCMPLLTTLTKRVGEGWAIHWHHCRRLCLRGLAAFFQHFKRPWHVLDPR